MDEKKIAERVVKAWTDPAVAVEGIVTQISNLQGARVSLLDGAGQSDLKLGVELAKLHHSLRDLLRRGDVSGDDLYRILARAGVNTGEMEGRLVDDMERIVGKPLYPQPWPAKQSKFAIVER